MFLNELSQIATDAAAEASPDNLDASFDAMVLDWSYNRLAFGNGVEPTSGDDTIEDGMLDSTVYGNQGNDVLDGRDGADTLFGGQGDDLVMGGPGNDALFGNKGNDTLYGGEGADVFVTDQFDTIADFDPSEGDQRFETFADVPDGLL